MFREYYEFLNKRLKYLHDTLLDFKSKRLAMINKDRAFFHYKSRDLVYIISPPTSELCTALHKVAIKYVGPVVIYKIGRSPQLFTYDYRWQNFERTI